MNLRKLGQSGLTVSALGLGCMGLTGVYGEGIAVEHGNRPDPCGP